MTTWMGQYNREITPEEQKLYDHLLFCVEHESPQQLIGRFRSLFIDGIGYPEREITVALDQLIASKFAEQEFKFVLNRCCHILINRWQTRSQLQQPILELVALFEAPSARPITEVSRGKSVRRLRELVVLFCQSEYCATLRRLARVIIQTNEAQQQDNRSLGTLIRRYPYLYDHCLLSEDSSYEHQQTIRQIQTQVQRQFEVDLSQYVTYRVRQSQTVRLSPTLIEARQLQAVKNPTLLSDDELYQALQQFAGRVDGDASYRDLAQRFLLNAKYTPSYATFKDDLYEYIVAAVDPEYGKRQFNNQLYLHLRNTLPDNHDQRLNEFLLIRTCAYLLNFLVVESAQRPNHFVFVDLITNLGATAATGLLLKIVLLCRKVKPYLEKRFSILFNHYEACAREGVHWLIQALENLNVALSTNFGVVDLSYIHQVVQ
ncbi:hypothetical protein NC998_18130 [Trichocoleus desertorum GB2-A4]|uniref:Uncharacterized protein n=2 Tax=Trichocoleusaceae TaxID=2303527 RepID=A0ABV0JD82_9CYAN